MNLKALTISLSAALGAALPVAALALTPANAGIEARVREVFADAPDMIAVAKCESGYRQFTDAGNVLRGGRGGGYIGVFQIGETLHAARALTLGHDIMTVEGNIGYARHLYDRSGTVPWRECVPSSAIPAPLVDVAAVTATLTVDLDLGARGAQVLALQRLLNGAGFAVAASGPGSLGHETDYYGSLTRDAVRRFQCAKGIVCAGATGTTGYGRVGPRTRAALLAS